MSLATMTFMPVKILMLLTRCSHTDGTESGILGDRGIVGRSTPRADAHSNGPKAYIWSGRGLEGAAAVLFAAAWLICTREKSLIWGMCQALPGCYPAPVSYGTGELGELPSSHPLKDGLRDGKERRARASRAAED